MFVKTNLAAARYIQEVNVEVNVEANIEVNVSLERQEEMK